MKFGCKKKINNNKALKAVYPNIKLGIVKKMKKKHQSSKEEKKEEDYRYQKLQEVNRYKQEHKTLVQKQDEIEREMDRQQEKITNIENHFKYVAEQFSQRQDEFEDQQIQRIKVQNQYVVQENNILTRRQEEFAQFQIQHMAFESNRQDEARINQTQQLEERILNIEKKYDELIRFIMYSS